MPKCENIISLNILVRKIKRRRYGINLDNVGDKLRISYNLCAIFAYMHQHNIYGIDGNPDNFLFHINSQLFTLIDTDSFQFCSPDGRIFRNDLGVPEIMPPEYKEGISPNREGDCYILAYYLFLILMDNAKPFVGTITPEGRSIGLTEEDMNQKASNLRCFAYAQNRYLQAKQQYLEEYHCIPLELQKLFYRSFTGSTNRATPMEWMKALDIAIKQGSTETFLQRQAVIRYNQAPQIRYPMMLLMDVSHSLGIYQHKLIEGFQTMVREMQRSSESDAIEFSLLEFAEKVDQEYDFAPVDQYDANRTYGLESLRGYYTAVAVAMDTALDRIRRRKEYYAVNGLAYKKPKLVLMTDAVTSTTWERESFERYIAGRPALSEAEIICIAIGTPSRLAEQQYQASMLRILATNHSFIRLNRPEQDLKSIFQWISNSVNI